MRLSSGKKNRILGLNILIRDSIIRENDIIFCLHEIETLLRIYNIFNLIFTLKNEI